MDSLVTDIDELWDFSDPAASEVRFRAQLETSDVSFKNEVLTQIARTYSLRRMFDEAHELLERIASELPQCDPRIEVRYLLERGRTWNSSGQKERARDVFHRAFDAARRVGCDHLTVDAAHMLGIVEEPKLALEWNLLALRIVEESCQENAKKWYGSLCNNIAWTYHDMGEYETALTHFVRASDYFSTIAKEPALRIGRWAVARCQRSLGLLEKALAEQLSLAKEYYPTFEPTNQVLGYEAIDGYIPEEIAECLYALGRVSESKAYFRAALERLSQDKWFLENEPNRIAGLRDRSE